MNQQSNRPASAPRSIFLFHIPKTGGISVATSVRAKYGPAKVQIFGDTRIEEVERRVRDGMRKGNILFFGAHMSPAAFPPVPGLVRTTVLRDPLEHGLSSFCYAYEERHAHQDVYDFFVTCPGYRAGRFDAADVERFISRFHTDNLQTRCVIGEPARPLDRRDLERAKEVLATCEIVGLTENLGAYLAVLSQIAGLALDRQFHVNTSDHGIIEADEGVLRRDLRRFYELDLDLYDHVSRRFAERAAQFRIIDNAGPALTSMPGPVAALRRRLVTVSRMNRIEAGNWLKFRLNYVRNRINDLVLAFQSKARPRPSA